MCVCVLVSICLAGLCAVWNYTPGGWAHTFSGAPVIALLGPRLWLWACLHHSHSVFLHCSLASSLLFFALSSTPLPLFSPCMAHYGWSPPAQSGNSLYKHTHIIHSHSAVFRAACRSGGLCTICYKTALLIVFGREMETIVPSHFFPPPTGANRQFLNSVLAVRVHFFTKPGPSTSAPAFCIHLPQIQASNQRPGLFHFHSSPPCTPSPSSPTMSVPMLGGLLWRIMDVASCRCSAAGHYHWSYLRTWVACDEWLGAVCLHRSISH